MRKILWGAAALVGAAAAVALLPLFFPNCGRNRDLAAGEERAPPGEDGDIATTVATIERIQRRAIAQTGGRALRDAHAKAEGCVKARFTIAGGLPASLAVGLFSQPRAFDAVVRFSNSSGIPHADLKKDGRGMAIKLYGVAGEKILDDERDATTHDFVMINHPVFMVRNAADYVGFAAGEERDDQSFFFGLTPPWRWRLHEAWNGYRITHHAIASPLEEPYFSMSAYRLGARAVKFSAAPCSDAHTPVTTTGDDALALMLANQLSQTAGCFDFKIQLQGDPHDMPVEDPTIEWTSPFATVARVEIASQVPDRSSACDDLSFTPWHALPEHRPLGGINRLRKAAYAAISKFRHEQNGAGRKEP